MSNGDQEDITGDASELFPAQLAAERLRAERAEKERDEAVEHALRAEKEWDMERTAHQRTKEERDHLARRLVVRDCVGGLSVEIFDCVCF